MLFFGTAILPFVWAHLLSLIPCSWACPRAPPLSRILFLDFIDDLLRSLASQASVQAFANDTVTCWIIGKDKSGSALENAILDIVVAWA